MELLKKQRGTSGFTIIEVMIVLAIAAIIMLIVFLAIPALQRNNRNTQRSNDAARVTGAINECLANNNGNLSNCNNPGAAQLTNYLDMNENQQLVNFTASAPVATNLDTAYYQNNTKCTNNAPVAGGGTRAFTIAYNVETRTGTAPRCVGS